jgi:hypothetical protein
LPAAHDIVFDPYTGDLLLAGNGDVVQIDPANPTVIISDLNLEGNGFSFDHVISDGQGHVFVGSNDGRLLFLDIRGSGLIGSPDFTTSPFLASSLDGLTLTPVPTPSSVVLLSIGGLTLLGYGRTWRRACG